jgi:hypothetical protein
VAGLIGLAFAALAAPLRTGLEACSYSVFWRQPIEWPTEADTGVGASPFCEPLLPTPRTGSRPEKHPCRTILDGGLYVVRTGRAWRYAG